MIRQGSLQIVALRPLNLSVDEALYELRDTVLPIEGETGRGRFNLGI